MKNDEIDLEKSLYDIKGKKKKKIAGEYASWMERGLGPKGISAKNFPWNSKKSRVNRKMKNISENKVNTIKVRQGTRVNLRNTGSNFSVPKTMGVHGEVYVGNRTHSFDFPIVANTIISSGSLRMDVCYCLELEFSGNKLIIDRQSFIGDLSLSFDYIFIEKIDLGDGTIVSCTIFNVVEEVHSARDYERAMEDIYRRDDDWQLEELASLLSTEQIKTDSFFFGDYEMNQYGFCRDVMQGRFSVGDDDDEEEEDEDY